MWTMFQEVTRFLNSGGLCVLKEVIGFLDSSVSSSWFTVPKHSPESIQDNHGFGAEKAGRVRAKS